MKRLLLFIVLTGILGLASAQISQESFYAASRLDYYTSEEVGEIMVYIPVKYKSQKITIDVVFEFKQLNRGFEVASSGVSTVPFPLENLREGRNEVTVSFNENDKWIDSRKIFVLLRPHQPNAVKIEKVHGGLYTNGLLQIPFGFYADVPFLEDFPGDEALNGFNMMSPVQCITKKSLKARKQYMDRCAALGLRVHFDISSLTGSAGIDCSAPSGEEERMVMLRNEVETFRDHPALLSWYLADKPDARNISPAQLEKAYQMIRELDPYHPVTLLVGSPRNAGQYRNVTDIIMTAPNPVPYGNLQEVKDYTTIPLKEFWLEKPVWIVPQAMGGNEFWKREPSAVEVRAMTYLAILSGASGIQYYKRAAPNSFPKSAATWAECGSLAKEIAEITPDLLSPHPAPEVMTDQPGLHAKAYNRGGLVTIIVVNDKPEPASFRLTMNGVDLTIKATVLFRNRSLLVNEGTISDIIEGYGANVYRFDSRMAPDMVKGLERDNLTVDPGFEDMTCAGVPAACFAYPGYDPGATYFIDSRRHYQGEHSLRLNNPANAEGSRLEFYNIDLDPKKSYTVSIMAMEGASSNTPGGKRVGPVRFRLGLGHTSREFSCEKSWKKYEFSGIRVPENASGTVRLSPVLALTNKGTAWFDLIQAYPDMEIIEIPGSGENLKVVELKCMHPGAVIFYTLDGSEPHQGSLPYQTPMEINNEIRLRAAAFNEGLQVGYIAR